MAKKELKRVSKNRFGLIQACCIAVICTGAIFGIISLVNKGASTQESPPISRRWMEYAMSINRLETRTPPTLTARFYSYVATVYDDVLLRTHSHDQASLATQRIIDEIFPVHTDTTAAFMRTLRLTETVLRADAEVVLGQYKDRLKTDGAMLTWDGIYPKGEAVWYRTSYPPTTPRAGEWKTWIVSSVNSFDVTPPPEYGSNDYTGAVQVVVDATKNRTMKDEHDIRYWNGAAGTEGPSGIWQNRLYEEVKQTVVNDEEYSHVQKVLAQSIADSFIAAWRVKYIYWTQRPSTQSVQIQTSFHDPPFPSYVSGHATVSSTAAVVLCKLINNKCDRWMQDARAAARSRLTSGVHFEHDNEAGIELGRSVGDEIVGKL